MESPPPPPPPRLPLGSHRSAFRPYGTQEPPPPQSVLPPHSQPPLRPTACHPYPPPRPGLPAPPPPQSVLPPHSQPPLRPTAFHPYPPPRPGLPAPQLHFVTIEVGYDLLEGLKGYLRQVAWNGRTTAMVLNAVGVIQDPHFKARDGRVVRHEGHYMITSCQATVSFRRDGEAKCIISLNLSSPNSDGVVGGVATLGCRNFTSISLFVWVFDQGTVPSIHFPPKLKN